MCKLPSSSHPKVCALLRCKMEFSSLDDVRCTVTFRCVLQHFVVYCNILLYARLALVWRPLACTILNPQGELGLNRSLFLMDLKQLNISVLLDFHDGLFKVWSLLKKDRLGYYSHIWDLFQCSLSGEANSAQVVLCLMG